MVLSPPSENSYLVRVMTYILSTTDGTLGLAHPCYRCGIQPEELPNFLTKVWRNMALVLKTTSVCFSSFVGHATSGYRG